MFGIRTDNTAPYSPKYGINKNDIIACVIIKNIVFAKTICEFPDIKKTELHSDEIAAKI